MYPSAQSVEGSRNSPHTSKVEAMSGPRASQSRSTNEGARKFRAYHSRSFFSNTNGMESHQLNITKMGRITTLRRLKGMDLNVRLKYCPHPCELTEVHSIQLLMVLRSSSRRRNRRNIMILSPSLEVSLSFNLFLHCPI